MVVKKAPPHTALCLKRGLPRLRDNVDPGVLPSLMTAPLRTMTASPWPPLHCAVARATITLWLRLLRNLPCAGPAGTTSAMLENAFGHNAGTVVDSEIVHPAMVDYFLNSHRGLQWHQQPVPLHLHP
jgi:hypothetical protein